MAYLDEHHPRTRQFRPRRRSASGIIVVHTAESAPDTVANDSGAEGVAAFIAGRNDFGSYHRICDSDTIVDLIRFNMVAYGDGTGSNEHAIHISAATQAHRWPSLPDDWVEATIMNMARAAHEASDYIESVHNIRIPAKRVSRHVSDIPGEGFISHAERDPERRTDPGAGFPWNPFLGMYADLERGKPPTIKPVSPTRGSKVDETLRLINRSLSVLEDTKGRGERGKQLDSAEAGLKAVRRDLREIVILKQKEVNRG